jgi:REP element-mobilizing transposase RayT
MDENKYKNKYRVPSVRLNGWDYGSHGLYFVTICTKDRIPYFGEIVESPIETLNRETQCIASLHASQIGEIAYNNWLNIPKYHPYVELDDFVIMPDHVHGILFLNKPSKADWLPNKFGSQSQNLASIIRGYKASIKQYTTINNIEFSWQPRYYDRVIRDEKEYQNIRGYIYDNPDNWLLNKDNFENLYTV